jgi:glutamate racemase
MNRSAIGIFDSGIGGLTVAAEVGRRLPAEDIIYLGDTARLPYGTKSAATVTRYAERAMELLLRYPVKAVVVACNTATAHALPTLRELTDMPVLGVVEPGARSAVAATRSGRIGITGTEATVRSEAYHRAIRALLPDAELTAMAWPLLVPLAEEGWIDHPVARLTVETYLGPLVEAGVDTLVLGCTHYPVFKRLISDVLAERFGREDVVLGRLGGGRHDRARRALGDRRTRSPREGGAALVFLHRCARALHSRRVDLLSRRRPRRGHRGRPVTGPATMAVRPMRLPIQ